MKFVQTTLILGLALLVATPLMAEDEKKKGKGKGRGNQLLAATMKRLAKAELTGEQKEKITAMAKEWQPKIAELTKKAALTKEQREKMTAARKKAAEEGKKGKEAREAMMAAAGLSEEQKEAQNAANKARADFGQAVNGLLSAEQKEKAGIRGRKKAPKKKKKDAA